MADDVRYVVELDPYGDERLVRVTDEDRVEAAWQFPDGPKSVPTEFWPGLRAVYAQPEEDVERVAEDIHDVRCGCDRNPDPVDRKLARTALSAIRDGGPA